MTFEETLAASRSMKGPLGAAAFVLTEGLRRAGASEESVAHITAEIGQWLPKLGTADRAALVAVLNERLDEVAHKDAYTDMVRLSGQLTSLEAHIAHDALEQEGLFSRLNHERTGAAVIPSLENEVEIWVRPDALEQAKVIIGRLQSAPTSETIACASCKEESPAHFTFCWACGSSITEASEG
jgi:hypothetical protein